MTDTPPNAPQVPAPSPSPVGSSPPGNPQLAEAATVSLRLMAGTVSKRVLEQLRQSLPQSEDPRAALHAAVLAEPVDEKQLLGKALAVQREWIARGGRWRGPSFGFRAKSLLARLCAQLVVTLLYLLLFVAALLALKYRDADWDLYRLLTWGRELFGAR